MAVDTKKVYEFEGVVKECLPNTKFVVEIDVNGDKRGFGISLWEDENALHSYLRRR